jgi:hypothetical protein
VGLRQITLGALRADLRRPKLAGVIRLSPRDARRPFKVKLRRQIVTFAISNAFMLMCSSVGLNQATDASYVIAKRAARLER